MRAVLEDHTPLWAIEGEKKSLAVAQLGLPAIGFCGVEGAGTAAACSGSCRDFDPIRLGRSCSPAGRDYAANSAARAARGRRPGAALVLRREAGVPTFPRALPR